MTQETVKVTVEIIFTSDGEIPDDAVLERLIVDQMAGELDEQSLAAMAVTVISRSEEID